MTSSTILVRAGLLDKDGYAGLASEPPARAPPSYESVVLEFDNTADPAREAVSDLTPDVTPDLATQAAEPSWD